MDESSERTPTVIVKQRSAVRNRVRGNLTRTSTGNLGYEITIEVEWIDGDDDGDHWLEARRAALLRNQRRIMDDELAAAVADKERRAA